MEKTARHFSPKIGILGGMGPEATIAFMSELLRRTQVTRDQDHLRLGTISDPAIPDRTAFFFEDAADILCRGRGTSGTGSQTRQDRYRNKNLYQ